MEKSASSLKLNEENYYLKENQTYFKCNECGEKFQKPILATVSSNVNIQKYFACPHCLTKVSNVKERKDEEDKEPLVSTKKVKKVVAKLEEGAKCNHFLGYLKKRPKNTPIPEECLTCDKMIDCLTG